MAISKAKTTAKSATKTTKAKTTKAATAKAKAAPKAKTSVAAALPMAKSTPGSKAPVAAPTPPKTTVVTAMKPVVTGAAIKKPELIERVINATGMKKKDVKPVVEAMLAVMGRSLKEGEELVVPPLGKVMVKRAKELPNATVLNVKVRVPKEPGTSVEAAE